MLAIDLKRGVESTLERVFKHSGHEFGELKFIWSGKTAAINATKYDGRIDATVYFPAIDETKEASRALYNELLGFALHELGHAWFTNMKPWTEAGQRHGQFIHNLINGLEDPRIERCVIDSGYAPNSKSLFINLINSVLEEGYVEPDDYNNIPFMLAVEGRRLNGYLIAADNILPRSPWRKDLEWALREAQAAKSTKRIVDIAIELAARLEENKQPKQDEQNDEQGEQQDEQGGEQGGDSGDSQGDEAGDEAGQDAGDKQDSGKGTDGKTTPKGVQRDVEPNSHIQQRMTERIGADESLSLVPIVGKPVEITFEWSE